MSTRPRRGSAGGPESRDPQGSCDVPDPVIERDTLVHRRFDGAAFGWEGVPPQAYKRGAPGASGLGWRDVMRHTLAGGEELAFQLRYFEIASGGFSSLEKHHHAHTIVVLRGRGQVIAGREVFTVEPFDLVVIPPMTPHQFVNAGGEPFGFLCPVDADRDPPQALTGDELARLMEDPDVRAAVRISR